VYQKKYGWCVLKYKPDSWAFELKLIAYKIASMAIIVLFADGWLVLLGLTIATGLLAFDVSMTLSNFSFLGHIQHYCGHACMYRSGVARRFATAIGLMVGQNLTKYSCSHWSPCSLASHLGLCPSSLVMCLALSE
jgi:hypothetical protein